MVSETINMDYPRRVTKPDHAHTLLLQIQLYMLCWGMSDKERDHNLINAMTLLALPKEIYFPSVSFPIFLSYDKYFAL